jgi:hypothetical protein
VHKEQIVGLAVRLFAIFLAFYTLRDASSLLAYISAPPPNNISLVFAGALVLPPILAAVLMWYFPLALANKLIPDIKTKDAPVPLDAGGIETVAFTIMGLWVLTNAIPDIFHWAIYVYQVKNKHFGFADFAPEHIGNIVSTVVEFVIGFWLLFGSRGLLGLIRRARHAGAKGAF